MTSRMLLETLYTTINFLLWFNITLEFFLTILAGKQDSPLERIFTLRYFLKEKKPKQITSIEQ